jgi:mono/diheme cytochrome c family protein
VNTIASTPAGRKYLASLVLNGMSGTVTVDNMPIVGVMPGFSALSDSTIAAILNYVQKFDRKVRGAPVSAADVKAARKDFPLAPPAVHALRDALPASEAIQH